MAVLVFDAIQVIKDDWLTIYPASNAHGWMAGNDSWKKKDYCYGDTLEEAVLGAHNKVLLIRIFSK